MRHENDRTGTGHSGQPVRSAGLLSIRKAIGDQEIDVIVELVTELEDAERKIAVYTLLSWMWALLTLCILYFR